MIDFIIAYVNSRTLSQSLRLKKCYSFKISSAIKLNTFSHGSHVLRSNLSTYGPTGLCKILFHVLGFQLASLVEVPTAEDINGKVVFVKTTISSAVHRAATSSILLK